MKPKPFWLKFEGRAALFPRELSGALDLLFEKECPGLLFKRKEVARLGAGPRYNGAGAPFVTPSPFTI